MEWLKFLVLALVIVIAGIQLSRYGDIVAEKTGLGGVWVGAVMLATATSLPELVTGISAVTIASIRPGAERVVDIAAGDVFGSCMFNLLIIAALDLLHKGPLLFRVSAGQILSAGLGVILIGIATLGVLLSRAAPSPVLTCSGGSASTRRW